ncbi:hypothetical protein DM01DRAFT_326430 [Hesseltinella vesiculosa]|uniref:Uncharacterized protein n=1 Tax=Hesseltinella vesiculosa TaxID=101127 RepID=A0A1X2GK08_9FUNG|nr:hypothetical protein DM01DRAFT_326430 [Hesseltinella vesiculosa]
MQSRHQPSRAMVTIAASYNRSVSDELKVNQEEQNIVQVLLLYQKSFPKAFELIMTAMDKPVLMLYLFMDKVECELAENHFIKIVQFVLTDWAGKRNRSVVYQP